MAKIEIYTQPYCPFCTKALHILSRTGAHVREIDAPNGTPERSDSNRRSGRTTVPQIFIDGRHIGGCDDLVALERAGKLDDMLNAA